LIEVSSEFSEEFARVGISKASSTIEMVRAFALPSRAMKVVTSYIADVQAGLFVFHDSVDLVRFKALVDLFDKMPLSADCQSVRDSILEVMADRSEVYR